MVRKWRHMPTHFGPYWFCIELEDRDLADMVRVESHQIGSDPPFYSRCHCPAIPIRPTDGWWLPILDERTTAAMTHDMED